MKTFVVYEHWRPDTNTCFYVGKGSITRARSIDRSHNRHHSAIVDKLKRVGLSVVVKIVFSCHDEESAFNEERSRIAYWNALGNNLANFTTGGEGPSGYEHTDDAKRKIREAHLGRKRSQETCNRIGDGVRGKNKGKKATDETRAKMRAARIGKSLSEETKRRLSISHTGKIQAPHTEEHKAKIGAASRGRKDTDDVRIKKSEAAKRRPPLSDEVRARIKAKVKLLWDDPEYRERMKLAHAGHVPSQETRDRMKIAQKKRRAKSASPLSEAM